MSEQQILDCSGAGSCNGGGSPGAINYCYDNFLVKDSFYPYTGYDGTYARPPARHKISTLHTLSSHQPSAYCLHAVRRYPTEPLSRSGIWVLQIMFLHCTPCMQVTATPQATLPMAVPSSSTRRFSTSIPTASQR